MLSYAEISEADLFFSGRSDAGHWQNLTSGEKENALSLASRLLDDAFDWKGEPSKEDQPMRWPRKNVFDLDGLPVDPETVPVRIRNAVFEQALFLCEPGNPFRNTGLKSASLGGMNLSFDSSVQKSLLAPAAISAVRGLGTLGNSMKSTAKNGTLMRG